MASALLAKLARLGSSRAVVIHTYLYESRSFPLSLSNTNTPSYLPQGELMRGPDGLCVACKVGEAGELLGSCNTYVSVSISISSTSSLHLLFQGELMRGPDGLCVACKVGDAGELLGS